MQRTATARLPPVALDLLHIATIASMTLSSPRTCRGGIVLPFLTTRFEVSPQGITAQGVRSLTAKDETFRGTSLAYESATAELTKQLRS